MRRSSNKKKNTFRIRCLKLKAQLFELSIIISCPGPKPIHLTIIISKKKKKKKKKTSNSILTTRHGYYDESPQHHYRMYGHPLR